MMFLLLLIILTNTASDILMKQFGHANDHKMSSEHCVLETGLRLIVAVRNLNIHEVVKTLSDALLPEFSYF